MKMKIMTITKRQIHQLDLIFCDVKILSQSK
jgi:hypothetical protein